MISTRYCAFVLATAARALASFAFACATPFAAFGVLAGATLAIALPVIAVGRQPAYRFGSTT
jgi:hypothetical protein